MTPKAWATQERNRQMYFIKMKYTKICVSNDIIKKVKKNDPQNGIKYLHIKYLIRILYLEYIKNTYNSTIKRQIFQLKYRQGFEQIFLQ